MAEGDTKGEEREREENEGARAPRDERHARDYWGTDGHGAYSGHFEGYGREKEAMRLYFRRVQGR